MSFNAAQVAQLLKPIRAERVLADGKGHSHVSQQDITAHLIRVFGFGNFDTRPRDARRACSSGTGSDRTTKPTDRFDVCYRAVMRLTVRDPDGREMCHFEDGSTATAQNQTLGDAHDLAMKSAISLAKKRTAINLGDQFGLSLYNKGQVSALVKGTLVSADLDAETQHAEDVQDGVAQQLSLGNDEIDRDMVGAS
jgi:hypothetical protein